VPVKAGPGEYTAAIEWTDVGGLVVDLAALTGA
jgi:hypothetical protein